MLLVPYLIVLILVIFALTLPFWRKDPTSSFLNEQDTRNQELADLDIEREVLAQSIRELEVEHEQGRMLADDYLQLKATDEHRLLNVLDRVECLKAQSSDQSEPSPLPRRRPWIPITLCTVFVIVASFGVYTFVQWQAIQKLAAVQGLGGNGQPNPLEMVAKLEKRLKDHPDDLQGQIMAGRSYQALARYNKAKQAWNKVLELDAGNQEAKFNLGIILVETRKFDDPEIFRQALGYFDDILVDQPNQPGVNWYRGVVLWHLKRNREAEQAWAVTVKNLKPGSEDRKFVKAALTKLKAGARPF